MLAHGLYTIDHEENYMKRILVVLLSLSMMYGLVGCNETSSSQSTAQGTEQESKKDDARKFEGENLRLLTWEGMFSDEIISAFEEETGAIVALSPAVSGEEMLTKLEAVKGEAHYDLVITDDYIIEQAIASGCVKELDRDQISNWENINPMFQGQFYDPKDAYTVPYGAGIPLIVYNPATVSIEIEGYEDLWDPALADSVAVIANYRVINGMALMSMGKSMNTENIDEITAAGEKLQDLAGNIRLINDDNTQNALLQGEADVAYLYTSQVNIALAQNPELQVVIPKEGVGFGVMAMAIPEGSANSELAHAFINYILRAEVAAKAFEWLGYYCTTKAAEPLIREDLKDLLVVPEGISGEMIENISPDANEAHEKIWTEFRRAAGS